MINVQLRIFIMLEESEECLKQQMQLWKSKSNYIYNLTVKKRILMTIRNIQNSGSFCIRNFLKSGFFLYVKNASSVVVRD